MLVAVILVDFLTTYKSFPGYLMRKFDKRQVEKGLV